MDLGGGGEVFLGKRCCGVVWRRTGDRGREGRSVVFTLNPRVTNTNLKH